MPMASQLEQFSYGGSKNVVVFKLDLSFIKN